MCICSCLSKYYAYTFMLLLLSLLDTPRRYISLSLRCLLVSAVERYVSLFLGCRFVSALEYYALPSSSAVFLNFLYFLCLEHLSITYRRPQGVYTSLHLSVTYRHPQVHPHTHLSLVLGPLEVNGLFYLWVIDFFSRPSSFLYRIAWFTFPDAPTDLFPLNLFRGWPK